MSIFINDLTGKELIRYETMKRSEFLSYLLWALFGFSGAHRLYLKEIVGFFIYMILFFLSLIIDEFFSLILLFWMFDMIYTWFLCDSFNKKLLIELKYGV